MNGWIGRVVHAASSILLRDLYRRNRRRQGGGPRLYARRLEDVTGYGITDGTHTYGWFTKRHLLEKAMEEAGFTKHRMGTLAYWLAAGPRKRPGREQPAGRNTSAPIPPLSGASTEPYKHEG